MKTLLASLSLFENKDTRWLCGVFLIWAFVVHLNILFILLRIPLDQVDMSWRYILLHVWTNWDGGHYISIAQYGYEPVQYAFSPLFPLLISLLGELIGNYAFSSLMISRLALIGSLISLYYLFKIDYDSATVRRGIIYLAAFPTSFFLLASYTEPVFLFFVVTSLYFARTNRWHLAGLFGGLSALTRVLGVGMFPILILEYLHQKDFNWKMIRRDMLYVLAVPLCLAIYMMYTYVQTGSFFEFLSAQGYWAEVVGRGGIHMPWDVIGREISTLAGFTMSGAYAVTLVDIAFTLLILLLIAYGVAQKEKALRYSYLLLMVLFWAVPVMSGTLSSMPRYALIIFPIFLLLARIGNNPYFHFGYLLLAISMQLNFLVSFVYEWWIA